MKTFIGCFLIFIASFLCKTASAQDSLATQSTVSIESNTPHTDIDKKKIRWVTIGHVGAYAGSLTGLSVMWYSKQPQTGFHFYDDNAEWLQVDKVGHLYSAYQISRASNALWQWAGMPRKKSIWIAGLSGLAFQSIIEVLDGFSAEYGFSWGDYTANVLGAGAFVSQELGWREQRLRLKFSAHPHRYPTAALQQRADDLYGKSFQERLLKDYNHQTYWLSADVHSLFKIDGWPKWLNLAAGYGAGGMFGGMQNIATDDMGNITFDRRDIRRYRQWYLSPDIDFTQIKTHSKFLKTFFFMLDAVKFPAPTLELSKGKLKGHFIYF